VPGSSRYFRGGVIAYANDVKTELLDVAPADLEKNGAVSERTARLMADGVRGRCRSDVGIAITGVAGPAGEGSTKGAGVIHVAVAGPGSRAGHEMLRGDHGREENRARAVRAALRLCPEVLSGSPGRPGFGGANP